MQLQTERARREAERRYGSTALAAYEHLGELVRQGWHVLEPSTPLVWNWHLDLCCHALERQALGDPGYRKLLFTIPPGTMKSLLVSVFAPAWEWLRAPERRKIFLANDDALAKRDSRRMRELITSDWYRDLVRSVESNFGRKPWGLARDQNEKVNFENTRRGFRQCLSMGGTITGKRSDDIVIDDPIDAKEVVLGSVDQVRKRLEEVAFIVDKVLPSRVNDMATARWTIIMQRLHEDDTAGRALREGGWRTVCLQMEYDPGDPRNHPNDPRRQAGELLFPAKFPRNEIERLKEKLDRDYSAQYQQKPLPQRGGPLKRWYWRFWYPVGAPPPPPELVRLPDGTLHECHQAELPERLSQHTQSWDMAFKDTKDSAFVVGQTWASRGADSYLLDQIRAKLDIVGSIEAMRTMARRWPQALEKLVEDKANGPAVIGMLQREIPGLVEVQPLGGKEARANAAAPVCRSGNVWLPHPAYCPWVRAFLEETEAFPAGAYADQVDSATQYINHHYSTGASVIQQLAQW